MQTEHNTRIAETHSAIRDQVLVRGRYRTFLLIASKTGCDKHPIQWLREAFLLKDHFERQILKISKELLESIRRCEIYSVLLPECNVAMGVGTDSLPGSWCPLSSQLLHWTSVSRYGFQLHCLNMSCSPPSIIRVINMHVMGGACGT